MSGEIPGGEVTAHVVHLQLGTTISLTAVQPADTQAGGDNVTQAHLESVSPSSRAASTVTRVAVIPDPPDPPDQQTAAAQLGTPLMVAVVPPTTSDTALHRYSVEGGGGGGGAQDGGGEHLSEHGEEQETPKMSNGANHAASSEQAVGDVYFNFNLLKLEGDEKKRAAAKTTAPWMAEVPPALGSVGRGQIAPVPHTPLAAISGTTKNPSEGPDCRVSRVGVVCDGTLAVIVQVCSEKKDSFDAEGVPQFIEGVVKAVADAFRKKDIPKESLGQEQFSQLLMEDGRTVQEAQEQLSEKLGTTLTAGRADCRRTSQGHFIGSYVSQNVSYLNGIALAEHGVVVILKKLNMLACCEEFSNQLCLHILAARPESLGQPEELLTKMAASRERSGTGTTLLDQRFYCDHICTVREAAKRSFVQIMDFVFYCS